MQSKKEGKYMHFTKMQGLGNDYLYVFGEVPENIEELSIKLSDRHFGPGADGMIYICSSDVADFKMRIFNADGSEAKMCGNGIRCVGKYVFDYGYTDKKELRIETLSGIKTLYLKTETRMNPGSSDIGNNTLEIVKEVTVDMGQAEVGESGDLIIQTGESFTYLPVSMGNPHAVIFTEDMAEVALEKVGPQIEHHTFFPGGVNTEFVQVYSGTELRMRVWERGSGITMACGTGTCASVMAAIERGYCEYNTPVTVHLDGGDLTIEIKEDKTVFMTGPAEFVYKGEIEA